MLHVTRAHEHTADATETFCEYILADASKLRHFFYMIQGWGGAQMAPAPNHCSGWHREYRALQIKWCTFTAGCEKQHQWGEKESKLETTSCNLQWSKFTWVFVLSCFFPYARWLTSRMFYGNRFAGWTSARSECSFIFIFCFKHFHFFSQVHYKKNPSRHTHINLVPPVIRTKRKTQKTSTKLGWQKQCWLEENCYLYLDTKQEVFGQICLNRWCFFQKILSSWSSCSLSS